MIRQITKLFISSSCFFVLLSFSTNGSAQLASFDFDTGIVTGASQLSEYLPLIKGKRIAVVANHTSMIEHVHLVDSLLSLKINIRKVFAPEHGFRGQAGAGEEIENSLDKKTKLPIISLYGNQLKPKQADLNDVDMVVFDIQDVGTRFYTYISTLQYVMESCAEKNIDLLVLDRPNPNGYFIDGPVLEKKFSSFVGLNPIPIVYGMTIGEYAAMVNGEHWLSDNLICRLHVVRLKGYDHNKFYQIPVKPSPNLPNMAAIYLYPSLCLFEGTSVSVGRGTDNPFQLIGYPGFEKGTLLFTPHDKPGMAVNPPYKDVECRGIDLKEFSEMFIRDYKGLYLFWIKSFYESFPDKTHFFNDFFNKLAGNETLQQQIKDGISEEAIKASWQPALENFKLIRRKYLLYEDFK